MRLTPRFVGRLGVADAVTVTNAALGFLAAAVATVDPRVAAQLILLAAVADGLDGIAARRLGSTPAGHYLDSLADVASFAIAPAVLATVLVIGGTGANTSPLLLLAAFGVPALYVVMAVVRLGLYTAYDTDADHTYGIQSTLAATIVAAATLADIVDPIALLGVLAVCSYLMVSPIRYPDLLVRDAIIMGVVHVLAILIPGYLSGAFPVALLTLALAYLALAPRFYWGDWERQHPSSAAGTSAEGKRS